MAGFTITPLTSPGQPTNFFTAEIPVTLEVTPVDQYGNEVPSYSGIVDLSTGDGHAMLNNAGQPITTLALPAGAASFAPFSTCPIRPRSAQPI